VGGVTGDESKASTSLGKGFLVGSARRSWAQKRRHLSRDVKRLTRTNSFVTWGGDAIGVTTECWGPSIRQKGVAGTQTMALREGKRIRKKKYCSSSGGPNLADL